jgi:flagellar motor switch protein FliN/FliY
MAEADDIETQDGQDAGKLAEDALDQAQTSVDALVEQTEADVAAEGRTGIDLLSDVDLQVSIELGRTHMLLEDVLRLGEGSVVELDKLAGDPVDVYVNDRLVARGEVLVLNDNFCIRISEIIADLEEQAQEAIEAAMGQ